MTKKETTHTTKEERIVALANIMRKVNKDLGADAIKFAKEEKIKGRISFGVEAVDEFTGGGAVPFIDIK